MLFTVEHKLLAVRGTPRRERCWFHKSGNVLDKLPKRLQPSAKEKLHETWMADTHEAEHQSLGRRTPQEVYAEAT